MGIMNGVDNTTAWLTRGMPVAGSLMVGATTVERGAVAHWLSANSDMVKRVSDAHVICSANIAKKNSHKRNDGQKLNAIVTRVRVPEK
jgi:hypothetical protein